IRVRGRGRREAGQFDRGGDAGGGDRRRPPEALVNEQLRPVDMIGGKRRVRRSTRQRNRSPVLVDDELSLGVAAQDAADEADVVQETGDKEGDGILWLDRGRRPPA